MLVSLIKKFIPKFLLQWYHLSLSYSGALWYGFPSQKLIVIGVTGTTGKSTTVNLIAKILEEASFKVGLCSTFNFKIGDKEWINNTKQTMPGRFQLQKFLKEMVKAGCHYAVIETSSEGIKQYRHKNINYDIALFTNLTPEHIESHGSFEKYREAKGRLFQSLDKKKVIGVKEVKKISVINLVDNNAEFFLKFPVQEIWGYGLEGQIVKRKTQNMNSMLQNVIEAKNIHLSSSGASFDLEGIKFNLKLLGEFNVCNALAAATIGLTQGISLEKIRTALEKVNGMPGRMEIINEGQNFTVVVDYAHEPAGLEKVYETIKSFPHKKVIAVLGSQGGGRDKQKRPILGQLASKYTDHIIVTNEDPYDDDPQEIIKDVARGAWQVAGRPVEKILDRRLAIKRALTLAEEGDIVVITGKGAEQNMVVKGGKKIPWDDRKVVKETLKNFQVR